MALIGITGNVRNRFIQAAVLLRMLDPVRGEPTVHGLDQDPHEIGIPRDRLLKRKFLDSFALICAVKKDGDSVSAACMEEGAPQGTIIRIASNSGVAERTLSHLRELVDVLNRIGSGVLSISGGETEILLTIIRLDIVKIHSYLKDLCTAKDVFNDPVSAVKSRIMESSTSASTLQRFLEWFGHIFAIRDLPVDSGPGILIHYIRWAQKARSYYLDFLKAAFSVKDQPLPGWICTIFKLGRYGIASRALVQLASEYPALNPMIVEPITAPSRMPFTIPDEIPLTRVLRRVIGARTDEYIPRLARVWNVADIETHFRRACSMDLAVHAEMQLVNFYGHNRQYKPSFRFIGVSKKSCYLCYLFLTNHPESFCVSSCHQKLYLPWFPPPAADSGVYKQYKAITTQLSMLMEAAAKQDLEDRLGGQRRFVPADSTAGVSLSGLTEPAGMGNQIVVESQADFQIMLDTAIKGSIAVEGSSTIEGETTGSESSFRPIDVASLAPSNMEIDPATSKRVGVAIPRGQILNGDPTSVLAMVFHFVRAGDGNKRDIISIGDIFDHSTNRPSWAKLLEILKADDNFGVAFKEDQEILVVNNQIRVGNERQFLACVQYLHNLSILSSEAFVYKISEVACFKFN